MSHWIQFPNLQFNEETHVYTWNGKIVPSVTQIFDTIGHRKDDKSPWVPFGCPDFAKREHDSTFGKALHKMANAIVCKKNVKFPDNMKPYYDRIKIFIDTYKIEPLIDQNGVFISEYPMYSVLKKYCGTTDLACRYSGGNVCIVDWKSSGLYMKSYSWQTAGYSDMLREVFGGVIFDKREKIDRVTVLITPERENPEPVFRKNNPEDHIAFNSLLNSYKLAA